MTKAIRSSIFVSLTVALLFQVSLVFQPTEQIDDAIRLTLVVPEFLTHFSSSSRPLHGEELPPNLHRTYIPEVGRTVPCIYDYKLENPSWNPYNAYIQRQPSHYGILFVKIEKAASTTLAGVTARIGHALYNLTKEYTLINGTEKIRVSSANDTWLYNETLHLKNSNSKACRVRTSHLWSTRTKKLSNRDRDNSFLFTFLKNPFHRALSAHNYFFVDMNKNRTFALTHVPSDHELISFINGKSLNFQLKKLVDRDVQGPIESWGKREKAQIANVNETAVWVVQNGNVTLLFDAVQKAIEEADFLGIVERMDESLVLLQLILGLRPSDVLTNPAKVSGGYVNYPIQTCRPIRKHSISPAVKQYSKSEEYKYLNYGDELLYRAANANLDRSIEAIGRDVFDEALAKFRMARSKLAKECPPPVTACSENGTLIPYHKRDLCYGMELNCGYRCLDHIFKYESE